MNAKVYAVWIDNPAGKLFAMVHEPEPEVDNHTTLLMTSAGQDSHSGPQRIYLKAARRFAAAGFRVVRLDLAGTGDSMADNPKKIALDSHSTKDVEAAVRWIRKTWGKESLYLVALCAGARVAIRYAANDSSIRGVVAWSVPTLSQGDVPYLNTQGVKRALFSKRLLTAAWWKNRWKYGFVELGKVGDALVTRLYTMFGMKRESYFIKCMDRYLRDGRPAHFIYGSLDKIICEEFQQRFAAVPNGKLERQCYWILPGAVHTLSTLEAHDAAIEMSQNWLMHRISQEQKAPVERPTRVSAGKAVTT
jgi:alpha-beta hydrolase superfamily lysophospholipase